MGIEGGNYQEPVKKRPESRMRRIMRAEMKLVEERVIKEHRQKLEEQRKKQAELRKKQDNLPHIDFQQKLKGIEIQWQKERNKLKDFISKNKINTTKNLTTIEEKTPQKELTDKEKRQRECNSQILSLVNYLKGEIKDLANIGDYGIQYKKTDGTEISLTFNKTKKQNNISYDKYITTFYLKNTKDNTTSTITIDRGGQLYLNGKPKYDSEEAQKILSIFNDNTSKYEKYWTKKMFTEQQKETEQKETGNADKWADEMLNKI